MSSSDQSVKILIHFGKMLGVYHSSPIYLLFITWSSRPKKQESSMKKMLSSSPVPVLLVLIPWFFMTPVFSIRSQNSRYIALICSNHRCDLINLCVLLLIFLHCACLGSWWLSWWDCISSRCQGTSWLRRPAWWRRWSLALPIWRLQALLSL